MVHLFFKCIVCQQAAPWPPWPRNPGIVPFILFRTLSFRVTWFFGKLLCRVSSGSGNSHTSQTWETGGAVFLQTCVSDPEEAISLLWPFIIYKALQVYTAFYETQRQGPCPMHLSISSVWAELWERKASRAEELSRVSRMSGWNEEFLMRNCKGGKSDVSNWSITLWSRGGLAMSCVSVLGREITARVPWNSQGKNNLKDYRDKCSMGPRASPISPCLPAPTVPQVVLFSSVWFVGGDHHREEHKSVF